MLLFAKLVALAICIAVVEGLRRLGLSQFSPGRVWRRNRVLRRQFDGPQPSSWVLGAGALSLGRGSWRVHRCRTALPSQTSKCCGLPHAASCPCMACSCGRAPGVCAHNITHDVCIGMPVNQHPRLLSVVHNTHSLLQQCWLPVRRQSGGGVMVRAETPRHSGLGKPVWTHLPPTPCVDQRQSPEAFMHQSLLCRVTMIEKFHNFWLQCCGNHCRSW